MLQVFVLKYSPSKSTDMKYFNLLGFAAITFWASISFQETSELNVVAQVASMEVDAVGDIAVNGITVSMVELPGHLGAMSSKAPTYIVLEISSELPMSIHNELMRELRASDISGISWETSVDGKGIEFFRLTQ